MSAKRFWTAVAVGIIVIAYTSGVILYQHTSGDAHLLAKFWFVALLTIPVITLGMDKAGRKLIEMEIPDWVVMTLGLTALLGVIAAIFALVMFLLP